MRTSDEHSAYSQEHVEQSSGEIDVMSIMVGVYGGVSISLTNALALRMARRSKKKNSKKMKARELGTVKLH